MRFLIVRRDNDYLIVDTRTDPPAVICSCDGWNRYRNAQTVAAALNERRMAIYDTFMPRSTS